MSEAKELGLASGISALSLSSTVKHSLLTPTSESSLKTTARSNRCEISKKKVNEWLMQCDGDEKLPTSEYINNLVSVLTPPVCDCWSSPELQFCRNNCVYNTADEYTRICQCSANLGRQVIAIDCVQCAVDFKCKQAVLKAASIHCICGLGGSPLLARNCSVCITIVKNLLSEYFPACKCKGPTSQDLFRCAPYCELNVSEIYIKHFSNTSLITLHIWKREHNSKPTLPTCECWIPYTRMVCIPSCPVQLSVKLSKIYEDSCPCKRLDARYEVSDEYVWLNICKHSKKMEGWYRVMDNMYSDNRFKTPCYLKRGFMRPRGPVKRLSANEFNRMSVNQFKTYKSKVSPRLISIKECDKMEV